MKMTLKEAREKRDLKQAELAEIMGVTASTICQWEKGVTAPGAKRFFKLCAVLRVTPNDIILP